MENENLFVIIVASITIGALLYHGLQWLVARGKDE
jgi:hypothetical protein